MTAHVHDDPTADAPEELLDPEELAEYRRQRPQRHLSLGPSWPYVEDTVVSYALFGLEPIA